MQEPFSRRRFFAGIAGAIIGWFWPKEVKANRPKRLLTRSTNATATTYSYSGMDCLLTLGGKGYPNSTTFFYHSKELP